MTQFRADSQDRMRDRVVRDLVARGFTHFADGTPLRPQPIAADRSFAKLFALDVENEQGALEEMMDSGEGPYGAPDAAPPDMTKELADKLLAALRPLVDDADYARYEQLFRDMMGMDAGGPPEFPGRPTPGGKMVPLDKRTAMDRSFDAKFPGANRIRHADPMRSRSMAKASSSFDNLFPGADRIQVAG